MYVAQYGSINGVGVSLIISLGTKQQTPQDSQ